MTRKITITALFVALAMVLSYVEALIPFNFGIPGVKLGLANLVVVTALYVLDAKTAFAVSVIRIILISVTFGNIAALVYSLAGGILSYFVMLAISRIKGFSPVGVSVAGGVSHNLGQLIAAMLVIESLSLSYYLPVLMIAGVITGLLIGLVAKPVIAAMSEYMGREK
ncbi:MAG: Gx transporter family protein [Lachnospiraceae bacterium]|nr:Gx transporter family protein [Lachnospiraceae bacterium]